jgi:hypothetical protein
VSTSDDWGCFSCWNSLLNAAITALFLVFEGYTLLWNKPEKKNETNIDIKDNLVI